MMDIAFLVVMWFFYALHVCISTLFVELLRHFHS